MYKKIISLIAVSALFFGATVMAHTIAKKGMKADLVLMPKFLGILVFDQANKWCAGSTPGTGQSRKIGIPWPNSGKQRCRSD